MAASLLTTKFYIPPTRPEVVPRPRLIRRLDEGLHLGHRLTLISAPAGFGKTTLLGEWVGSCGQPAAWISLDEDDSDPARFFSYFVAALQTIDKNIGEGLPDAPQPSLQESLFTELINQIDAAPDHFILVLDDYHLITARPIHDALTFLLDHLPCNMHLAIATRADPPLSIARLRSRGQLTELRLADLRLTADEVAKFLNQVIGPELAADDVAALISRTEGWIAGLQMAAMSMQGREDIARFIQDFTGSNRYILDYLVEEVLQRQPENIQTFLLQTSILNRLTGPLCDAVVGEIGNWRPETDVRSQSLIPDLRPQTVLEYLDSSNLFIIPLDSERRWYRYHRLFSDLLRSRLHQAQPELVPTLHLRASQWYEQNGLAAEAISHTLSAKDYERAADLIEQVAEATLMRSEVATFSNWVEMLPDELVRARPTLYLFHAWALVLSGGPLEITEAHLRDVARSTRADENTDLVFSKLAIMRAFIATFQDQLPKAAEMSRQALERLPKDDAYLRNIAAWILGMTHLMGGDVAGGIQTLGEVIEMSQEIGNVMVTVAALTQLAELYRRQGKLHAAKATHERALELATDSEGRMPPVAGKSLTGLGKLWREWNDFETATRYFTEGIELTRQWREVAALEGYIYLARIKQAQGDWSSADDAIQKARQLAVEFDATEIDDVMVALQQVRLWIGRSDDDPSYLKAAMSWLEERGLDSETSPAELVELAKKGGGDSFADQFRQYEYAVLAQVLIKQGRPAKALVLLEPLLQMMEQQELTGGIISLQILRALAFQAQNDVAQAMAALEHALTLAEPGGYVRVFVDEGKPMAQLLLEAARRGIAPEYVSKLLAAFEPSTPHPETVTLEPEAGLIEPLTERELEVLRLLPTTLSTPEIAEQLVVSVNTVRSHVKNIYSKFGVHRRTEAVQRAIELGLI